jgi:hypothetical protein
MRRPNVFSRSTLDQMKTTTWRLLLTLLFAFFGTGTLLRAAEDPAHNELRALRTQVIEAITKGDFDSVVRHVHPNVVVTWQN